MFLQLDHHKRAVRLEDEQSYPRITDLQMGGTGEKDGDLGFISPRELFCVHFEERQIEESEREQVNMKGKTNQQHQTKLDQSL